MPWLVLAVLVLPPFVWILVAIDSVRTFGDQIGGPYAECDREIAASRGRFDVLLDSIRPPEPLGQVGEAVDRFFAQSSWSFSSKSAGDTDPYQLTKHGNLYERRSLDGSFTALVGPDRAIARTDGARLWVAFCPQLPEPPLTLLSAESIGCLETTDDGTLVTTRWKIQPAVPCSSPDGVTMSVTTRDGALRAWTLQVGDNGVRVIDSAYRVEASTDPSWPSRVLIAPKQISDRLASGDG